jgi:hypothetical protein
MSLAITKSQYAKDGIHVTYSDNSTQNLTFVDKKLTIDKGLTVTSGGVNVTGDITSSGTITANVFSVTGATTFSGSSNMSSINVSNTAAINTLAVSGTSALGNTLSVAGAASLNNSLVVAGTASFNNSVAVSGAASMNSTLAVTGAAHLNNTLAVAGAASMNSTLAVTGASSLNNTLAVAGAASLSSSLAVNGASNLNNTLAVTGATSLHSSLEVDGESDLSVLNVSGAATLHNNLSVAGDADLSVLNVSGAASLSETLEVTGAAVFHDSMTVHGNLTVLGSTTSINTVNLEVKDNAILISDANIADTVQSGIMLQYQPAGTNAPQYAGLKRVPVTGEFVFFKDSSNQIGLHTLQSADAVAAVDNAQLNLMSANNAVTVAQNNLTNATNAVETTLSAKNTAQSAIPSYTGYVPPPSLGEYITIDYHTPTETTGWNAGSFAGWTTYGDTDFFGSDDNSTWSLIESANLNRNNLSASWSPVTYRYLRIVFKSFDSSYYGQGNNRFCPNFNGGTLSSFAHNQVSLSPGFDGFFDQNGGQVNFNYVQLQFKSGLYAINSGDYTGTTETVVPPSGAEYDSYLQSIVGLQADLAAAVTAYNLAVNDKTTTQASFNAAANAAQTAANALAAAQAFAAASVPDVYATVIADSFNSASDGRLKKDIVPLDDALGKLDSMRGVRYNWIDTSASKDVQVGVIAQEIQSVYPELVREGGNGFLSVDYPKLTAVLLQAVKELKALVLSKQ